MYVVKKLFLKILLVLDVLAFIIYSVCATMLTKYNSVTGVVTDGFGRVLVPAPALFRSSYLGIEEWAGFGWFIVDTICAIVLIFIAYLLYETITDKK